LKKVLPMFGNLHFSGVVASKRKVEVSRKKVSKMRSVNCCTEKMKQDKRKASIVQSKILPWCQISHSAQSVPHGILLGSAFPKPCFTPSRAKNISLKWQKPCHFNPHDEAIGKFSKYEIRLRIYLSDCEQNREKTRQDIFQTSH
jgi:hypothetical protein